MARSELFKKVKRALRSPDEFGSRIERVLDRPLDRRAFLRGSLATSALVAGALYPNPRDIFARVLPRRDSGKIAIVGAGLAGLTAAFRLRKLGHECTVFEASSRAGGRVHTRFDFHRGMFAEIGGELIDRNHLSLLGLAGELGLEIESFPTEAGNVETTLFNIGGQVYTEAQLAIGAAPLVHQVRRDRERIFGSVEGDLLDARSAHRFPNAVAFDRMTLAEYLDGLTGVDAWVRKLVGHAYVAEFGLELDQQSALNLHLLIDYDLAGGDFDLFGASDESLRVKGGNSRLVAKLAETVETRARDIQYGHRLVAMEDAGARVRLHFEAPNGSTREFTADRVVCAIPFSLLRGVEIRSPLSATKAKAVRRLAYGTHAKMMAGTPDRFWRRRHLGIPRSNGAWLNDLPSQAYWETSRGQAGTAGILTCFRGGNAGLRDLAWGTADDAQTFVGGFLQPYAADERAHYGARLLEAKASVMWAKEPFALGSYFCPRPGDTTEILGATEDPEWNGKLLFAGEHTTSNYGYMDSAVESANRAVESLVAGLTAAKRRGP